MNHPAGIVDGHIEFFDTKEGMKAFFQGKLTAWNELPVGGKELLRADLEKHPEVVEILEGLVACEDERLRMFAKCKFGGLNNTPDITACGSSSHEHWECNCQACPLKPVLRGKLEVSNGHLTQREIELTKLISRGLLGKEIADKMQISESTLNTHKRNVFDKVGVDNNVELAIWAIQSNLT